MFRSRKTEVKWTKFPTLEARNGEPLNPQSNWAQGVMWGLDDKEKKKHKKTLWDIENILFILIMVYGFTLLLKPIKLENTIS